MTVYGAIPKRAYLEQPRRQPRGLGFERHSLLLDGAEDYIDVVGLIDDLSGDGDFTAEIMLKAGSALSRYAMSQSHTAPPAYASDWTIMLGVAANLFWMRGVTLAAPAWFDWTRWNHLVLSWTKAAATYEGIVNGISAGISGVVAGFGGVNSVKIGTRGDATTSFFRGLTAFVRIYKGIALSVAEARWNLLEYHNPVHPGNLVLWLPMEEGTGLTVVDHSGVGNDGSLFPVLTPPVWRDVQKWELRVGAEA